MSESEFEYSITILIVDGDEASRRLLAETLAGLGYRVLRAADIAAGWKAQSDTRVDLIVTDIFAPGGAGADFLLQIKRERPEIAVIVMSSLIDQSLRDDLIGAGADGVLAKPFRIAQAEDLISQTLLKYDRASRGDNHPHKKVLIVDDDPALLEFMAEGLRALGYDVAAAGDTDSAFEAFDREKPDLVVCDYMLSGHCGVELIRKLKALGPDVPAVIVTGYPVAFPPDLARADGIEGYLIKPFRINQLERVITELLYSELFVDANTTGPINSQSPI
jgi:CheY-like chemotaxis protein